MAGAKTEALRRRCDGAGVPWTAGFRSGDGRVEMETVTAVGKGLHSLTFAEIEGELWCEDAMSVEAALAAGMQAWAER